MSTVNFSEPEVEASAVLETPILPAGVPDGVPPDELALELALMAAAGGVPAPTAPTLDEKPKKPKKDKP